MITFLNKKPRINPSNNEPTISIKGVITNDEIDGVVPVAITFDIETEREYFFSEADIKKLMTEDSLDAFLDALDFAPEGVIDMIKEYAELFERSGCCCSERTTAQLV